MHQELHHAGGLVYYIHQLQEKEPLDPCSCSEGLQILLVEYTPAVDIWSIGCIFAEMLTGKPLFPGKNVVHQLELITDLLGTPSVESVARIRNEKARRYLSSMRQKSPVPFNKRFPYVDPLAVRLLERLLEFDPRYRITAEEALAHPYFHGLANEDCEPSMKPISKFEFEFERRKLTKDDMRVLIYREILEYHPQMLKEYLQGDDLSSFMYPSGLDQFKQQFACLEENPSIREQRRSALLRKYASLPRERVCKSIEETLEEDSDSGRTTSVRRAACQSPPSSRCINKLSESAMRKAFIGENGPHTPSCSVHYLSRNSNVVLQSAEV